MERWIAASFKAGAYNQFLMPVIQGLGKKDIQLRSEDADLGAQLNDMDIATAERMTDQGTLSYMWVLAAYEVIRTLNGLLLAAGSEYEPAVRAAKHQFERVRMPLAKLEAARRFPDDYAVAWPAMNREVGFSWFLNDEFVISRAQLSDIFLSMLENIPASAR